jgi:FSR family fosmidomycin resistance protein-like MFS transporter
MGWKTGVVLILLVSLVSVAGKALGGILGDRFGARTIGVSSLILAAPCLAYGNGNPWICCIGVLLLNMSMPITLCLIAQKFPAHPGLAFGIASLAILAGAILALLPLRALVSTIILCTAFACAALLNFTVIDTGKRKRHDT